LSFTGPINDLNIPFLIRTIRAEMLEAPKANVGKLEPVMVGITPRLAE
jgi:hypothetical protein